jgi:hypothetical protein
MLPQKTRILRESDQRPEKQGLSLPPTWNIEDDIFFLSTVSLCIFFVEN